MRPLQIVNNTKITVNILTAMIINFPGINVTLICKVFSNTNDGLPYPEVTWLYPPRLRDYVEFREGDNFNHTDYIKSLHQSKGTSLGLSVFLPRELQAARLDLTLIFNYILDSAILVFTFCKKSHSRK